MDYHWTWCLRNNFVACLRQTLSPQSLLVKNVYLSAINKFIYNMLTFKKFDTSHLTRWLLFLTLKCWLLRRYHQTVANMSSSNREPDFFDIFLRSFNFRRRKSEKQDDDDDATRTNERMFIVKDLFMDGICERRKKTRLIHLASVRKLAKKNIDRVHAWPSIFRTPIIKKWSRFVGNFFLSPRLHSRSPASHKACVIFRRKTILLPFSFICQCKNVNVVNVVRVFFWETLSTFLHPVKLLSSQSQSQSDCGFAFA